MSRRQIITYPVNIYLNDFVEVINALGCGINLDKSILLYVDTMVLLAPTEEKWLTMINSREKWKMKVSKSKIVNFRTNRSRNTSYVFRVCYDVIVIVEGYTYPGMILDEHLDFKKGITVLSQSAGRVIIIIQI